MDAVVFLFTNQNIFFRQLIFYVVFNINIEIHIYRTQVKKKMDLHRCCCWMNVSFLFVCFINFTINSHTYKLKNTPKALRRCYFSLFFHFFFFKGVHICFDNATQIQRGFFDAVAQILWCGVKNQSDVLNLNADGIYFFPMIFSICVC